MTCDLELLYAAFAESLPSVVLSREVDPESVFLTRDLLPRPAHLLTTPQLQLQAGPHQWNGYFLADRLDVFAKHRTIRQLGALILAVVFHPEPATVELALTNPASTVRRLRIRYEHGSQEADIRPSFWSEPRYLEYSFFGDETPHLHVSDPAQRPLIALTDADESGPVHVAEWWTARDTVILEGGAEGLVALGTFLLDIAVFPDTRPEGGGVGEWTLPSPLFPRMDDGLAPLSAETRFALPGSYLWQFSSFTDGG